MAEEKGLGLSAQQAFNNPALRRMAQVAGDQELTIEMNEVPAFSLIPSPADEAIREACRQCGVAKDEIVKQPGTYSANFAFRLPDCLDIVRYRASWAQVIAHLPILRTRIIYTADSGFQQVVLKFGMEWSELDADSLESTFTSERQLMETVVGQPLSKYAVAHTKDQGRVFIRTAHHYIYDGWTISKVFALVEKVYINMGDNAQANEFLAIRTSAIPFNRFIRFLGDHDSEQTANFWRKYLTRVLQFSAHACDVIISDIFTTPIHGGCVCVPSEHDRMNNLAGAVNSLNATQVYLTTTLASQLHPDQVPDLRVLCVGGERVTEHVVHAWA